MSAARSLRAWMALRRVEGLGDAAARRVLEAFRSPEAVLSATLDDLVGIGGLRVPDAQALLHEPTSEARRQLEAEFRTLQRLRLSVVTCVDADYPPRLSAIADPPPFLYLSGTLIPRDHHAVAIVGSRRVSAGGRQVTEELSRELARAGFTIVSGLARGVDGAAHRGALAVGGRTVAVLGCGVDVTYPPEHRPLREQIEREGAVVSELPLGAPPHAHHFPKRNRIISGLSMGVVVTEAAESSGSLITARLAAEQGREVFALPGFVKSENSRGPNGLIKQGAKLVETVEDIIEELLPQLQGEFRDRVAGWAPEGAAPPVPVEEDEAAIYAHLSFEPVHIDALVASTGLPAATVTAALLRMELRGSLRRLPGQCVIRI
jgi:DNA processing protein